MVEGPPTPPAVVFQAGRDLVRRARGAEHGIEHEPLVHEPQLTQLGRRPRRLGQRRALRAGNQHDDGPGRVGECLACLPEAGSLQGQGTVRAQAGGNALALPEKARPGMRQAQEPERMAGRRGVEDHMVELLGIPRQ